ncbi:MAG: hypothetical protein JSW08_02440 [archaeon]|nr:MAG: hypothetical protein JSW08_02440 [archaeon]
MSEKIKAGIEIHQQLDTNKLFCSCPSILKQDKPDKVIRRKIKAVAGESGKVDVAAYHEELKDKTFIYEFYKDVSCLVELDEEPPHEINKDALIIALQLALIFKSRIFPAVQVMRKTIINGSCVSGFQRTALVAEDGFFEIELEGKKKKIGIQSITLEEDAAREIRRDKSSVTFRLDRLGIPLVEIVTKPDITTPKEAKIAALKIGEILRACKVKRGIGTIRQDLNISTPKHPRVEIKGVQEPYLFEKVLEYEAKRQAKSKEGKPEVRKANEDGTTSFLRPLPGSARMYPETDVPLIYTKSYVDEAKKNIPKLHETIKLELKEKGMNPEMIKLILKERKLQEFKSLLKAYNKPDLVVKFLILWPKEIASHEKIKIQEIEKKLPLDILESLLEKTRKKEIQESQAKQLMLEIIKGKSIEQALKTESIDPRDLEAFVQEIVASKPGLSLNAYMGLVMKHFKGKVNPAEASEILKKYTK